ncbi:hypothetical protein N7U66_18055 [Lacinutrix neustonica]|uniref:Uncharacterized protein n=1 Tax=Lacinutrix neustonica TaxID=2980107 RepID=A0A9E8MVE8_9FLAO|nr:hypothetical protein [Lacinutrix neustonica]WAC01771.1 hypothetical protein N7U66_18055 [Lacinutrix neustonica]
MKNTKAIKSINKILKNLDETGINTDTLIDDIKELRTYALEAEQPLVVKVLRYTYEHIEKHNSFLIPLLDDEAIDEENAIEQNEEASPVESLKYLIALTANLNNKGNISDLKEYKELLMAY